MTRVPPKKKNYLKLVHDRSRPELEYPARRMQLLLPLSIPHNIVVVDVSQFRYHDLESALSYVSPRWVFDFRRISRFDNLAGSRSHAFRLFKSYGTGYADILGMFRRGLPFKEMTRISLWRKVFQPIIRRDSEFSGPIIILSEDIDQFSKISDYVLQALNRSTKENFGISVLHRDFVNSPNVELADVM